MSQHRILSVGQCGFDHSQISRYLRSTFGAEVQSAESVTEAFRALRSEPFDLVLVNRVFDGDGTRGADLIRAVKSDAALAAVPVMLVSDYPDAQADAEALGAVPGFGKSALYTERAARCVAAVLQSE